MVYSPPPDADEERRDSFWRLARSDADNYLLASRKSLINIDLRITNSSQELFSLPAQGDVLTSIEDQRTDHIVKLCSTRDILWIDTRFAGKPLLGYRHGRQYDRYLNAQSSPLSSGSTLLTSRNNAMMTVYDVTRSEGQLIHVNAPPYCMIPGDKASASKNVGQTLFKHPLDTNDDAFSLLRLMERGCLQQVDLRVSDSSDTGPIFHTSWSTDVKQLDTTPLRPKTPPHDKQAFIEKDFSEAYQQIYHVHYQERVKTEEENANAVYDLLETIPTFWQEVEPPLEHIITTYDAVFHAGDDPDQERSNFLTESSINSTRGYRAVSQGRLAPKTLIEGAAWHHNIAPILRRFDPNFPSDIQSGTNALRRHDLAKDPERTPMSLRYENEAREQLALDLALSTDVFSSQKFSTVSGESADLETMARTLSLAGEPPTVDFGYLRPRRRDHYNKEEKDQETADSMGVRLLLKDWEVGADPDVHIFVDHYDGTWDAPPARRNSVTETTDDPGDFYCAYKAAGGSAEAYWGAVARFLDAFAYGRLWKSNAFFTKWATVIAGVYDEHAGFTGCAWGTTYDTQEEGSQEACWGILDTVTLFILRRKHSELFQPPSPTEDGPDELAMLVWYGSQPSYITTYTAGSFPLLPHALYGKLPGWKHEVLSRRLEATSRDQLIRRAATGCYPLPACKSLRQARGAEMAQERTALCKRPCE
ncbi:hypothetical protein DXG03_000778 [Asterophora parasitica]|uniref:Uncharacterized protein n=1 Tax=Asterophora parasitica TaxID=117018 RepID=A0A9P7GBY1_9AGAR|nr:hypothetical protein DXG03_000778 [Asterophora parasitica]